MNSYAHAQLAVEDWNKANPKLPFKYIPGCEMYFHPSLKQWEADKLQAEEALVDKKAAAKLLKEQEKLQTKIIAVVDEADETEDIEMTNALTVENEDESKSTKHFNPVNRRHHLVVLPKNQQGLLSIFSACSKAYMQGFYRFPRIDLEMLKEAGKDRNIVVTSACIGGFPSWSVFQVLQGISFDNLNQTLLDDKALLWTVLLVIAEQYGLVNK
jgi:DNA polymerase III alpha subunit